jgi:hypothetical protein
MERHGPVRQILRIALLALVLAAQTVAHAHAAEHGSPVGKAKCPVCSVTQSGGTAVVDCNPDAAAASPAPTAFAPAAPPIATRPAPVPRARAPPRSL